MTRNSGISKHSASDLKAQHERGESRTSLARMPEEGSAGAEHAALRQLENDGVAPDWFQDARLVRPEVKKLLSLRLDNNVVDWFRNQGAGYQSRMNAVLRSTMTHAQRRPAALPVPSRKGKGPGR